MFISGEEAFLGGLRRFFAESTFRPARTADFEAAMEAAAGRPLDRFFDLWIRGTAVPSLRFTSRVEGSELVVHIDELNGVFEVPVPVVLRYANRTSESAVIDVAARSVDTRIPLKAPLQRVDVDRDLTLAQIDVR